MKSYAGIIIAFLIGVFAVSAGWGGAIYTVLLLIGLLTIVVLTALALTHLDKRKPEENQQSKAAGEDSGRSIEDGTWTLNLGRRRPSDGAWTAWLERQAIVHPRFQRARFVLAEGPAVLISAADLRRALADWLADPNGGNYQPFKIDFEYNTVNGVPVEMSSEK